jgi:hypothetical protein
MEVAAGIAAEVFDLIVDPLGQIGGTDVGAKGRGVFDKAEVVGDTFLEMFDPSLLVIKGVREDPPTS